MITLSKVKDYIIENGKRILKVLQFGAKTAKVASSYGDDSNPIDNMTAIYADTSVDSEPVILGYINTNQIADKGEKRMFSQKINGDLSFEIYLKNDGSCKIKSAQSDSIITLTNNGQIHLNGSDYSSVRFENLQTAINQQNSSINNELVKISAAINSLGGTYSIVRIQSDLTSSKSDTVKIK